MNTIASAASVFKEAPTGDARLPWLEANLADEVDSLSVKLARYSTFAVCEVARMNFLPWNFMQGVNFFDTEGGPARIELLTLLAEAANTTSDADASVWHQLGEWKSAIDRIIQLAALAHLERAVVNGAIDPMAKIQASTRAGEVLMRNSSYPEMVKTTLVGLFGEPSINSAVVSLVGFTLSDAIAVLEACDTLQTDKMAARIFGTRDVMHQAMTGATQPTPEELQAVADLFDSMWDPSDEDISVRPAEISELVGLDEALVTSVLHEFSAAVTVSPLSVVDEFTSGNNLLRTHPVVKSDDGRFMVVHQALVLPSIRENFEQRLKNSTFWNLYSTHRGKYLEDETLSELARMFPGAQMLAGFEYFVPVDEAEKNGDASHYTKLVEGDLLLLLDDVAIIAEQKAVALSPSTHAGDTNRLRNNLTRIVTKASEQADRLKRLIEDDGGFRLKDGTWHDTTQIREVHTIAVSLDDLSGVSTATSDLLMAGLIEPTSIPWTVSLNDLRLIVELVDETAVASFLLYLRRRRHPEVTVLYSAVDELDFFIHFLEDGLYVQPDPDLMQDDLEWITTTKTGDRRRRNAQGRVFITSRTDPLDAWFTFKSGISEEPAPKPALKGSPALDFTRELQIRRDYGWCTVGATLLSGSTRTQQEWIATPAKLLQRVKADGKGHHLSRPYGARREESWLLVWAVEKTVAGISDAEVFLKDYMQAKKYQLQVPRAAAFIFGSDSLDLHSVLFDGSALVADERLLGLVSKLHPADKWQKSLPRQKANRKKKPRS